MTTTSNTCVQEKQHAVLKLPEETESQTMLWGRGHATPCELARVICMGPSDLTSKCPVNKRRPERKQLDILSCDNEKRPTGNNL